MVKSFFSKVTVLVISFIIFAALLEGSLRTINKKEHVVLWKVDPVLDYIFVPNVIIKGSQNKLFPGMEIKINSQGLREDYDVSLKKQDEYRIIVIGDSMTFGYGVNLKDSYSKQLEQRLNTFKKGQKFFNVINAGVPGRNLEELKKFVLNDISKYDPDLVILGLDINDIEPAYNIINNGGDVQRPPFYPGETETAISGGEGIKYKSVRDYIREYSVLFSSLEKAIWAVKARLKMYKPYVEGEFENLKYLSSDNIKVVEGYEKMLADVATMSDFLKANKVEFLVGIIPYRSQVEIDNAPDNIQEKISKFLTVKNIMFVDFLPSLLVSKSKGLYLPEDGHPNEIGHKIIADDIAGFLGKNAIFFAD